MEIGISRDRSASGDTLTVTETLLPSFYDGRDIEGLEPLMSETFRPCDPGQQLLRTAILQEWLPGDHQWGQRLPSFHPMAWRSISVALVRVAPLSEPSI